MEQHDESNSDLGNFGPTYKSLFIGCCIVLGSMLGWYFTSYVDSQHRFNAVHDITHQNHDKRLVELEARISRNEWEREGIKRDLLEIQKGRRGEES